MAMQVSRVENVNYHSALPSPTELGLAAGTGADRAGSTGSLDPLIIALARAVDRAGPAQSPGRRPETAS
jgi:hypothetical protein